MLPGRCKRGVVGRDLADFGDLFSNVGIKTLILRGALETGRGRGGVWTPPL